VFFKIVYIFIIFIGFLHSDIIRPAYLEIIQKSSNNYAVLLKVPTQKDKTTSLKIKEIEGCMEKGSHAKGIVNGSSMDRFTLICKQSLKGKRIEVQGLENTKMDLLLRLEFLDSTSQSMLLNPLHRTYTVKEDASSMQIIQTYTWLGITHILMGFDHLLFVFALLLIVKNIRRLLWTITAFTLAHSITMAGATLGLVHIPQQPVEAIIALSILFLAMEIIHEKQGKVGLASRYPWIIAFIFGLLHGFGFAGALAEIGLPEQAITLALIFFNIGVELGQLMFVATVVLVAMLIQRLDYPQFVQRVEMVVVYGIGTISAFWMIERIAAF
jgi:hydrogenase/urease accessory protein HupE